MSLPYSPDLNPVDYSIGGVLQRSSEIAISIESYKKWPEQWLFRLNIDLILIIGSFCQCHCERLSVPCYFLAPCDKRKHIAHAHQEAANQASTDSAWRHPMWLPHSSLDFQRPVYADRRSYRLTPQSTIALGAIVAVNVNLSFIIQNILQTLITVLWTEISYFLLRK